MLRNYEAFYDNGILEWIGDKPQGNRFFVIVTVIEKTESDDIEEIFRNSKGIVKPAKSMAEIDQDVAKMRMEWNRE
jgi:hypothetical protein